MPHARLCPACGGSATRGAFVVADFEHVRCRRCGTLFITPLPAAEVIESLYLTPEYRSSSAAQGARMRAEADARAAVLRGFGCRDVLEVGCGDGHFLDAVRDLGMRVEGVDRTPMARGPRERGHLVHDAWLQDLEATPRFDAVALWEVIEHLAEPRESLLQVRRFLRPGGRLALSTPSWSGVPARLMRSRFVMISPPEHLEIFSRRGLALLLRAAGFEPVRWTSFSGLGREPLRRGFQRYLLGDSAPARALAAGLAAAAELPMRLVDRVGLGISFEIYAVAR